MTGFSDSDEPQATPRQTSEADNPYVGPRPFEAGEVLYGREPEIRELEYLWNAERIVLLHSPSGAGKSSLIQAGLLPRLQGEFDVWRPTRVNLVPPTDAKINRYVLSALQGFEEDLPEHLRRPPELLAQQTLNSYFEGRPRRRSAAKNIALLFDQFEEILTVEPLAVDAKRQFFEQLGELLRNPRVWALFSLREDYLAPLDPYAQQVPTHLKNRFRIDLLSLDGARQAIVEPARLGGRAFPAVDELVHDLATMQVQQADGSFRQTTGHHVEPVQLQVVCWRLWNALPDDATRIETTHLARFGDVTEALAAYYAESVEHIAERDLSTERAIRQWFGNTLITAGGIRGQVLKGAEDSGGLSNHLIDALLDTHLVRAEKRAGATWYELAHDRLIGAVQDDNPYWFDSNLAPLQLMSTLWDSRGRPPGLLLRDQQLRDAEAWAREPSTTLTEVEEELLALSRQAFEGVLRERTQNRRIRWLAAVSVAIGIIALWLMFDARRAEKRAAAAEAQSIEESKEAKELLRVATGGSLIDKSPNEARLALLEVVDPEATPGTLINLYRTLGARLWMTLEGHDDALSDVQFSPDGKWIVTASFDGTASLWDALTGRPMTTFGHQDAVVKASFSHDGLRILTASYDTTARLWDAATGHEILRLTGHTAPLGDAIFSPDGRLIATASWDSTARLWDADTGEALHELTDHRGAVKSLAFDSRGEHLVTASGDKKALIWDVATGNLLQELQGHAGAVTFAVFSPDDRHVLTSSGDETARLWDAASGRQLEAFEHRQWRNPARFSPDGALILTTRYDQALVWRRSSGEKLLTLQNDDEVIVAEFSPDSSQIVTGATETGTLWDADTGQPLASLKGHRNAIEAVAFSPNGRQVVTASVDLSAKVWSTENAASRTLEGGRASYSPDGRRIVTVGAEGAFLWDASENDRPVALDLHESSIWSAEFSSDSRHILTASADRTAQVWDAATGEVLSVLRDHEADVAFATFDPSGERVVTASEVSNAFIWEAATGKLLNRLEGHEFLIDVSFSPDGRRIVTASSYEPTRIWNASTGEVTLRLPGPEEEILDVAWSPDGLALASASRDRKARLWQMPNGGLLQVFEGHRGPVNTVEFTADGSRLLTSSDDSTARLWNVADGRQEVVLRGHTAPVWATAISPDGRRIATAGRDNTARLWDAASGEELASFDGDQNLVRWVAFSPDNLHVLASEDVSTHIWPNNNDLLLGLNRARTYACLDTDFRQRFLSESAVEADRKTRACQHCVPKFFEKLAADSQPSHEGQSQLTITAWQEYRQCLNAALASGSKE